MKPVDPQMFTYAIAEIAGMANNTIQNPIIQIDNNFDFLVDEIRGLINCPAALTGPLLITMSMANGELFSNVALDAKAFSVIEGVVASLISGYPRKLSIPVRIAAASQINIQVNNTTGQTVDFQLQLHGYKVPKAD